MGIAQWREPARKVESSTPPAHMHTNNKISVHLGNHSEGNNIHHYYTCIYSHSSSVYMLLVIVSSVSHICVHLVFEEVSHWIVCFTEFSYLTKQQKSLHIFILCLCFFSVFIVALLVRVLQRNRLDRMSLYRKGDLLEWFIGCDQSSIVVFQCKIKESSSCSFKDAGCLHWPSVYARIPKKQE